MEKSFKKFMDFSIKAFNLCNGKINLTKKVREIKLIIGGKRFAYISDQGIFYLKIRPLDTLNNTLKTQLLDIIVHELSHLDQIVDYNRYNNDNKYMISIEDANIKRTYDFIITNKEYFEKELDFEIDMNYMIYMRNLYDVIPL